MEFIWMIGALLGQIAYFLMPQRRAVVIRNLRIVFGQTLDINQIKSLSRKTFRVTGANLISSIPVSILKPAEVRARVDISGHKHLTSALKQGQGCILLLAHMGNWELLTQLPILVPEIKSTASLYRPLNNPLLDNLVKQRREKKGAKLFSRTEGFAKSITHLREGGCLGVIADQHAGSRGLAVPLFGKLSSMTNLPALLHRKTKAPILPISMCTVSPGRWKIIFHPALHFSDLTKANTHSLTCETAKAYESIMWESPTDVLWMHGYWKVGRRRPLHIDGLRKIKVKIRIPNKPFRIIVFTGAATMGEKKIINQLKKLKNYRSDIHITTVGQHSLPSITDHHIYHRLNSPLHLISNRIRLHDLLEPTPIDCSLDITADGSGGKIMARAGLHRIFCRSGKFMSTTTQTAFTNRKHKDISLFLESLGLNNSNEFREQKSADVLPQR